MGRLVSGLNESSAVPDLPGFFGPIRQLLSISHRQFNIQERRPARLVTMAAFIFCSFLCGIIRRWSAGGSLLRSPPTLRVAERPPADLIARILPEITTDFIAL